MKKHFFIMTPFSLVCIRLKKELESLGYSVSFPKKIQEVKDSKNHILIIDLDEKSLEAEIAKRHFFFTHILALASTKRHHFPYPLIQKQNRVILSPDIATQIIQHLTSNTRKHLPNYQSQNSLQQTNCTNIHPLTKIILIGVSTGGPKLIEKLIRSLPKNYPHPICIVQHMPKNFTSLFAQRLNTLTPLQVLEARENEEITPGKIIIAKGGFHLHFATHNSKIFVKLAKNSRNRFFTPSVDEMFLSALATLDPRTIVAILLTGIGDDGADGMVALKKAGAYTIAESKESATVYGMPKEAFERGGACSVLDFDEILTYILQLGEKDGI